MWSAGNDHAKIFCGIEMVGNFQAYDAPSSG